jgi:alkylated DNA repair dioxygenase AlkB
MSGTPASVPPARPADVQGLTYLPNFLTEEEQAELLWEIDARPWLTELRRRVQHYGYKYDYKARSVDYSMRIGPLPEWALGVIRRLRERGLITEEPDQVIVNEYEPGQGIAAHVDCPPCFTETILSLSLGSPCVMDYKHKATRRLVPVLVEPGSLIVMRGEARYDWTHGIAARKTDVYQGRTIVRGRRVSLTLRKVILGEKKP